MSNKSVLIVGLGNPGIKYQMTRHNIGMLIVKEFAKRMKFPSWTPNQRFNSQLSLQSQSFLLNKNELNKQLIKKHLKKQENQLKFNVNNSSSSSSSSSSSNNGNSNEIMKLKIEKQSNQLMKFPIVDIHLMLPLTYMNLSGSPIRSYMDSNGMKIKNLNNANRLLVITDDITQPIGSIKLKMKGGSGGHNGLQDIENKLRTSNYHRLKIGIAPYDIPNFASQSNKDLASFVLQKFNGIEQSRYLPKVIDHSVELIQNYVHQDVKYVMSRFNK
jgi:PTH1 family peptidyl-tRNA hydrolase